MGDCIHQIINDESIYTITSTVVDALKVQTNQHLFTLDIFQTIVLHLYQTDLLATQGCCDEVEWVLSYLDQSFRKVWCGFNFNVGVALSLPLTRTGYLRRRGGCRLTREHSSAQSVSQRGRLVHHAPEFHIRSHATARNIGPRDFAALSCSSLFASEVYIHGI